MLKSWGYLITVRGDRDAPDDVINDVIHFYVIVLLQRSKFVQLTPLRVKFFCTANMYAFGRFVLNIVVFHTTVVIALDVRIETMEDDGTKDAWTFNNDNLTSRLQRTSV